MKNLIAFIMALTVVLSFVSCGKKEIVGYDPEVPQEWIDAFEEREKMPTREVIRTGDFAGIWQNEITGEYFHMYNGEIYLVDRPDASEDEVEQWGTATLVQVVDKEIAYKYELGDMSELVPGEEQKLYHSSISETESVEKVVILENNRTKVVTTSGREITFKFIKEVTDHAAGFETQQEFDY